MPARQLDARAIELEVDGEGVNELSEDRDNRFVKGLESTLVALRGKLPEQIARGRIVGPHFRAARCDKFRPCLVFPDIRRGPVRFFLPRRPPQLVARLLVEGYEE